MKHQRPSSRNEALTWIIHNVTEWPTKWSETDQYQDAPTGWEWGIEQGTEGTFAFCMTGTKSSHGVINKSLFLISRPVGNLPFNGL